MTVIVAETYPALVWEGGPGRGSDGGAKNLVWHNALQTRGNSRFEKLSLLWNSYQTQYTQL